MSSLLPPSIHGTLMRKTLDVKNVATKKAP
jgi:hypothetical protein